MLLPSDPENYYEKREIVRRYMLDDVRKARIIITNYHAFRLRETLKAPKLTKELLQGRRRTLKTTEKIARVCPEWRGATVINDEAHHCDRHKVGETEALAGEEREEAKKREEAARIWISGIEAVKRKLGVKTIYDLSATPFFLRGSGYKEGIGISVGLYFSLMDAIELGIVKVPRVPVIAAPPKPRRNLRTVFRKKLPRKGRAKQQEKERGLDPASLPTPLLSALDALYDHYAKVFALWQGAGQGTRRLSSSWCAATQASPSSSTTTSRVMTTPMPRASLSLATCRSSATWRTAVRFRAAHAAHRQRAARLWASGSHHRIQEDRCARDRGVQARDARALSRPRRGEATDEDLLREVMNTVWKMGRSFSLRGQRVDADRGLDAEHRHPHPRRARLCILPALRGGGSAAR